MVRSNGNGKSTLLKCVMGIVPPSGGSIIVEIDGARHELIGKATEAIVELGVGFVPEGRRLFPKLSVTENLLVGAFRRAARAVIARNMEFCFETFPRLKERSRQLAGSMSGGEQQMLALARALMSAPRILLIDEPSVGLVRVSLFIVPAGPACIAVATTLHSGTALITVTKLRVILPPSHQPWKLQGEACHQPRDALARRGRCAARVAWAASPLSAG